MKRLMVLGVAGLILGMGVLSAADDKVPSIKQIMKELSKGPKSVHPVVGKGLKAEEPNWSELAPLTKKYADMAAMLGKNECPQGDKGSWEKLCKAYADNAKALNDAVGKKDRTAALDAHKKLSGSCSTCHDEHR